MHATFNWFKIQREGRSARGKERETKRTVSDAVNILEIRTKFKLHPIKKAGI